MEPPEVRRMLSVDTRSGEKSQELLAAAIDRFHASRIDECLTLLQTAVDQFPSLPPADLMLARMYLRTGNGQQALHRLDRLAVEHPRHPEVFVSLGELALSQGRLADAWLQLTHAAEIEPPSAWDPSRVFSFRRELAQRMGEAAERRLDWSAADQVYRSWLEQEADSVPATLGLARSRLAQSQFDEAIELFRSARAKDPSVPSAEGVAALFFGRLGDHRQAGPWFERAVAAPDVLPAIRLDYVRWLLDRERPEDALSQLEALPDTQETRQSRHFLRGIAAREQGDLATAEAELSAAQRMQPLDWAASDQLALVLIEDVDEAKRVRAWQLADANLKQSPNRPQALATAGWIQLRLGDLANAERLLQQSLQSGPPLPSTRYYISRLLATRGRQAEAENLLKQALDDSTPWFERRLIREHATP